MLKKFIGVVSACCLFFSSLAGCTININIGNADENTVNETNGKTIFDYIFNGKEETTIYESRAVIYISHPHEDQTGIISSSDLATSIKLVETYNVILQSSSVQDKIRKEYSGAEYELSLEHIDETETFALIATSETPEYLEDICNMAASLLCEIIPQVMNVSSCKIVDYAKPAQLVGIN